MARRQILLNQQVRQEIDEYRRALNRAKIPVTRLIVFGSQATGKAHPDSDIDVAVISPSFGKNPFREGVRLMRYRSAPYRIEPQPFHPDDLNDRWSTLAHEVRTHGIVVE